MKKTTRFLLVVTLLFTTIITAQSTISGTVIEAGSGIPLLGANVVEKGTSHGVTSDFDGNFTIITQSSSGEVVVSYVGYETLTISFNGNANLGNVKLTSDNSLGEVIIVGVADIAIDRKTPVAVSNVKAADIALKLSTQEFPEILKAIPGVYATKAGGGYGDARVNIRGFSSENVAVMINGIPVNDMENGAVYWSNWAGLGDVTNVMQVQRGLGASKVAVPSIGGTINIITKSTEAVEGGDFSMGIGNNGYTKYGMTYSTGQSDKGFAATVSAAKIFGDGYVDGTPFSGYNYFVSLAQQLNDSHKLEFIAFGAQQTHGQRYNRRTIVGYKQTESGPKKFNPDWGYKDGKVYNSAYNFYHKPQISLNHSWDINESSSLNTSLYASFGSGGGRRFEGTKIGADNYRLGDIDQPIDFDTIIEENRANGALGSTDIISSSRNSHNWFGLLSSYKNSITEDLVISGGLDLRQYKGSHWYEVDDLLGGQFFLDDETDTNAYGKPLRVGDRYNKDYDGFVFRTGLFGQAEYQVTEAINTFVAVDVSNTNYYKEEQMNNTIADSDRKSDDVNFLGYGIKGGGNYNLDGNNNVFVNVGYFSKAPFLNNAFQDEDTVTLNEDAENEKVFSLELGYGYRSSKLRANVNLYRTSWLDKANTGSLQGTDNKTYYYNLQGLDALHQGVELDFIYSLTMALKLTGMLSVGDWQWKSNVSADIRDQSDDIIDTVEVFAKDTKVGNSAQTTFALGANYTMEDTKIYIDYNYAGNMYSDFDVTARSVEGLGQTWKVPSYGLFDVGLKHTFTVGSFEADIIGKINNVLNTSYISDSNDSNYDGTADAVYVYYGAGRTYSVGLKLKF